MLLTASGIAACLWLALLVVPWRPWSTRESIAAEPGAYLPMADLTALIPARDEAECIGSTLRALAAQGTLARIVVIDDQSADGTGEIARAVGLPGLEVLTGTTPPPAWSGKLWALEQGLARVATPYTLLLDADITLAPGLLAALKQRLHDDHLTLASIMATLHMRTFWERLLLPPFVYFFKLIYPFALANRPDSRIAAAAGGCILLETRALREIGGFAALHDAIIDDCTLARRIKARGGRTWLGLSRDVQAIRPYGSLANIWNMVARSAFTQLRYSTLLLAVCTVLLVLSFVEPLLALAAGGSAAIVGCVALAAMLASYRPTLRYYGLHPLWTVTLPCAACLFLAMTWTSAWRYWSGERSRWKHRSYARIEAG